MCPNTTLCPSLTCSSSLDCSCDVSCYAAHLPIFCVPQVDTLSREQDENLRKWQDKTPAMAAIKGTAKVKAKKPEKGVKKK
eukprot:scaffold201996_cov18-Tisochrysis_lutea.AAC.1